MERKMKVSTVIIDIPDQGLVTRFGVTMPVGKTEAPGYHIVKRKDKPSRERWRGEKGEILGGAFFLDNPKINFKDCDDFGVRNVSL